MTDNEIIKALECCARLNRKCNECPLLNDGAVSEHCISVVRYETLSLIKRQITEIQGWKEAFGNLNKIARPSFRYVDNEKNKAITEFAERLKDMHKHNTTSVVSLVTLFGNINKMVEEMTEDDDGA